jgi:hypothetical protein
MLVDGTNDFRVGYLQFIQKVGLFVTMSALTQLCLFCVCRYRYNGGFPIVFLVKFCICAIFSSCTGYGAWCILSLTFNFTNSTLFLFTFHHFRRFWDRACRMNKLVWKHWGKKWCYNILIFYIHVYLLCYFFYGGLFTSQFYLVLFQI